MTSPILTCLRDSMREAELLRDILVEMMLIMIMARTLPLMMK